MAKLFCDSCGRPEEDCGVAIDCCTEAHAGCIDCQGQPIAGIERTSEALARVNAPRLCVSCEHPTAAHSFDGPCWIVAMPDGKSLAIPHWNKTPAGARRCRCRECVVEDEADLDINMGAS